MYGPQWCSQSGIWVKIHPPILEKVAQTEKLFKIARDFQLKSIASDDSWNGGMMGYYSLFSLNF